MSSTPLGSAIPHQGIQNIGEPAGTVAIHTVGAPGRRLLGSLVFMSPLRP